jgi:hypothetical protein
MLRSFTAPCHESVDCYGDRACDQHNVEQHLRSLHPARNLACGDQIARAGGAQRADCEVDRIEVGQRLIEVRDGAVAPVQGREDGDQR